MSDFVVHSIGLEELPSKHDVKFIEAQWWDDESPLVVVVCLHRGDLTKLRMDLDKKSFIDHLTDSGGDKTVQSLAIPVWEIVARERFQGGAVAQARAYK
jgi:hypothetical protein